MDISDWSIDRRLGDRARFLRSSAGPHLRPSGIRPRVSDGNEMALRLGTRTILAVPLLRADEAIGAINVRRTEV